MSYRVFVVVLIFFMILGLVFSYLELAYDNKKQRLRINSVVLVDAPEKVFYIFKGHHKHVTGIMKSPSTKLSKDFKIIKTDFCHSLKPLKIFIQSEKYLLWYLSPKTELKDILCLDKLLRMYPRLLIAENRPSLKDDNIYPIRDILLRNRQWRSVESFV